MSIKYVAFLLKSTRTFQNRDLRLETWMDVLFLDLNLNWNGCFLLHEFNTNNLRDNKKMARSDLTSWALIGCQSKFQAAFNVKNL